MKLYALVDACNAPDFLEMLDTYDPPASCLFNDPLQEGMAERAPYLVELTEPVKSWLAQLTTPWGLYLISKVNFLEMRKHLRRYTFALIPIEEKPVFFRFYDPRVFWDLTTKILDDWQLHAFLGPIEIIASYYDGHYQQESFDVRRAQFPDQIRMKTQYLTLTDAQYHAFVQIYEERYIEELAEHMMRYVDPNVIEEAQNNAERVHREMLEHARDVQGAAINHPADQAMLLAQPSTPTQTESTKQQPSSEKAFFHFSRQTGQWRKITGSKIEKVEFVISQALTQLARTPINEETFHELTQYEYRYLGQQSKRDQAPADDYFDYTRSDSLRAYCEEAYFYYQHPSWYYVDDEAYAYPIDDERVEALTQIGQHKIFEAVFHHRTNNRYRKYRGLAYLSEFDGDVAEEEKEAFEITTMDELRKTIIQFSRDLYYFCETEEVTNDHWLKELSRCFIQLNIFRHQDINANWVRMLQRNEKNDTAIYRVRMLIGELEKYIKQVGEKI